MFYVTPNMADVPVSPDMDRPRFNGGMFTSGRSYPVLRMEVIFGAVQLFIPDDEGSIRYFLADKFRFTGTEKGEPAIDKGEPAKRGRKPAVEKGEPAFECGDKVDSVVALSQDVEKADERPILRSPKHQYSIDD